ncbi:hypothetical protein ACFXD5_26290 [Streptomyces sp. NPDC059385]|uniref:hypothetical protein n=1 Tax=Streptomyces sp. NPDC059385 TaxID=3346817 RepID=UPI0036CFDA8A
MMTPLPPLALIAGRSVASSPYAFITAAVIAVPLLLYARPSAFGWAVGFVSALLVPLSLSSSGAVAGMFFFLPSVPQLLPAAGADPRRRPVAAKVMAGTGLLLSAAMLALCVRTNGYAAG